MINIWHYLIIQAPKNGQFRIERVPSFNGHLVFWQTGIYMPNTGMITIKIIKPLNIGWSHIWLNWVFPVCIYSKTRPWPTQKRLTQRVLQSQSSSRQKVVVFYGFLSPPSTIPYSPIYHPISFEFCIPSDQKSHAKWGFEQHSGLPFQDVHPGGCDLGTFGSACASHHGSHHHIQPAGFFGFNDGFCDGLHRAPPLEGTKNNWRIFPDLFAKNIICLKPEHELLGMGMFEMRKHSETKQLPCKWIKWPSSYPISAALENWLLWLLSCVLHPLSQHAGDFRHEAFEAIAGAVGVVAPVQQNLQQNQLAAEGSPRKYGSKEGNTKHHQTRNT